MKVYDYISFGLIFILATLLFLPSGITTTDGQNISYFTLALNYGSLNWSFYYFYFISFLFLTGITWALIYGRGKTPDQYSKVAFVWLTALVGWVVFYVKQRDFIEKIQPQMGLIMPSNNASGGIYFLAMLFGLLIILGQNYSAILSVRIKNKSLKLKQEEDLNTYIGNKERLYENTILLNPPWYASLTTPQRYKVVATGKELIISTSPLTIIPLSSIKDVQFWKGFGFPTTFDVNLRSGKVLKMAWAPENEAVPYSLPTTTSVFNVINKIVTKSQKGESIEAKDIEVKSKHPYLWSLSYLVVIIVGQILGGIAGLLCGFVIIFGLNKTWNNPTYKTSKKVLFSFLYVMLGVVVLAVASLLFSALFSNT